MVMTRWVITASSQIAGEGAVEGRAEKDIMHARWAERARLSLLTFGTKIFYVKKLDIGEMPV